MFGQTIIKTEFSLPLSEDQYIENNEKKNEEHLPINLVKRPLTLADKLQLKRTVLRQTQISLRKTPKSDEHGQKIEESSEIFLLKMPEDWQPTKFRNNNAVKSNRLIEENALNMRRPNLRQTQICIRKCSKLEINKPEGNNEEDLNKNEKSSEIFLRPMPKSWRLSQTNRIIGKCQRDCEIKKRQKPFVPLFHEDNIIIRGKVEFCLKKYKLYPNLNTDAVWDIYGKLHKIIRGKNDCEFILLVRNMDGKGPVLQAIFYDFNNFLAQIRPGTLLRMAGHFSGESRFHAYKLKRLEIIN